MVDVRNVKRHDSFGFGLPASLSSSPSQVGGDEEAAKLPSTKRCSYARCRKRPTYGVEGSRVAVYCAPHSEPGMVNVSRKRCGHPGCNKHPSYGVRGTKSTERCATHALPGMVDVWGKRCAYPGCAKHPTYGVVGSKRAEFCAPHAPVDMVNVSAKKCGHAGCTKQPSFGVNGSKTAQYCMGHAKAGMVDVRNTKRCGNEGCTRHLTYGADGTKMEDFCHECRRKEGMVNFMGKKRPREHGSSSSGRGDEGGDESDGMNGIAYAESRVVEVMNYRQCAHPGCTTHLTYDDGDGANAEEFCSRHLEKRTAAAADPDKTCKHPSCPKYPSFPFTGGRITHFCDDHAQDGRSDIRNRRCCHPGCTKHPTYGVVGTKSALFCAPHAQGGMLNVSAKKCGRVGCTKQPSYGLPGTRKAIHCVQHAEQGMVDVRNVKRCNYPGCSKHPSYGVPGTKRSKAIRCSPHAEEGMVNVMGKKRREHGSSSSGGGDEGGDGNDGMNGTAQEAVAYSDAVTEGSSIRPKQQGPLSYTHSGRPAPFAGPIAAGLVVGDWVEDGTIVNNGGGIDDGDEE